MRGEAIPGIWPRIGLWGRFDVASLGDLIGPRVFETEIHRRLPRATVQAYAPLGPRHPVALDGGLTAKALGAWSRRRTAELADEADCVVIGGGNVIHTHEALFAADYGLSAEEVERLRPSAFFIEGLGPSLERRCPIAWNAVGVPFPFRGEEAARVRAAVGVRQYLSVRDVASKERLREAGVESDVEVVPDPILLAARAFPPELLVRRLDYLKFMDWFPSSIEPVVLQGAGHLIPRARSIAGSLLRALRGRSLPIVLLETEAGRAESEFLDAIAPHLGGAVFRVPSSAALSDIVAVLAHARVFVGTSAAASLAATAFGVPAILLNLDAARERDAVESRVGHAVAIVSDDEDLAVSVRRLVETPAPEGVPSAIEERLRAHFDRLADIADSAVQRRWERGPHRGRRAPKTGVAAALRDAEARIEALRAAYQARTEQMLQQRFRIVEALEARQWEVRKATEEEASDLRKAFEEARDEKTSLSGALAQVKSDLEASHARELEAQRTMEASHAREIESQKTMERLERDMVEALAQRAEIEGRFSEASRLLSETRRSLETEVAAREKLLAELSVQEGEVARLSGRAMDLAAEQEKLRSEVATLNAALKRIEDELSATRRKAEESDRERARAQGERERAEMAEKALAAELERLGRAFDRATAEHSSLALSRLQALAELEASRAELARVSEELDRLRSPQPDRR